MLGVIKSTLNRSFSSASEVSLEGWCARVQIRQTISVVRPRIAETLLECLVPELFERLALS